jgi:NADPH:quinone reductase-like Zn-dependent oxidoreductase
MTAAGGPPRGRRGEGARLDGADGADVVHYTVSFAWMPAPSVFGWPEHRERQRRILEQAAAHFDAGDMRVEVGATFPLERAADSHRALEAGQVTGKAVLIMD